jgi:hypothetical protein
MPRAGGFLVNSAFPKSAPTTALFPIVARLGGMESSRRVQRQRFRDRESSRRDQTKRLSDMEC